MVVYLDILFAVNTIMDLATLTAAARLGGIRVHRLHLLLASAVGGAYAVLAAVWPYAASLPLRLLSGFGICSIAFARQGKLIRMYGLYLLVAAAFAGLAAAFGMAAGRQLLFGAGYYFAVPLRMLVLAAAVGYAVSGVLLRGDALHGPLRREVEMLTVRFLGKEGTVSVLHDTGNTLSEPVSGRNVVVIERSTALRLLGSHADILRGLTVENTAMQLAQLPPDLACRFGLLPYHAIGTKDGLLLYFRPDSVTRADGSALDCVIAVSPEPVGQGAYEGLIGI